MHFTSPCSFRRMLTWLVIASFSMVGAADRTAAPPPPESIAQGLEGVWVYVGEPGHISPAPRAGGRFKFRMSNRWTYTQADPSTGEVKAHFGGSYRVRDKEYSETIEYSTDPSDPELKNTLKFTVKIERDLMTQIGIGNPYTEVWQRVR